MKIYWWLGLQRTYAMHAAICKLQQQYGWNQHAAYVVGDEPYHFLDQQQNVHYEILDEHDKIFIRYREIKLNSAYLNSIEEKYGLPSLWPYAYADRHLTDFTHHHRYGHNSFSHDDIRRIIQVYFEYYLDVFERFQPDVVITYAVASMPALILYHIARQHKIPFLCPSTARISNRYLIVNEPYQQWPNIKHRYNQLRSGHTTLKEEEARALLTTFKSDPSKNKYKRNPASLKERRAINKKKVFHWASDWLKSQVDSEKSYRFTTPIQRIQNWLHFSWYSHQLQKPDFFEAARDDEPYAFFPLHVTPEASTMIFAPMYLNQLALIEQISQSLPINFKLYVKEHIPMLGRRPLSFYQRLQRLPNVRLIDPYTRSFDLITNCRLVITITGTVGWEALQLGKPVITFGRVFYNMVPLVRHVTDTTELPQAIHEQLTTYQHDETQVVKLLAALLEVSFPFDISWYWGKWPSAEAMMANQEQVDALAQAFGKAIKEATGQEKQ